MGNRKKKLKLTREEYRKKFNEQMQVFNYIMQEGEQIIQCKAPYPEYWFISNKGYLFSAYYNNARILKANHRNVGLKNKEGNRTTQDWYYEYLVEGETNKKHVPMHKIMGEHFGKNEFGSEETEVHHIRKRLSYKPNDGNVCNRAENLQLLPKEIHKELTRYASKTNAEMDEALQKKISEAECPSYILTQEMFEALIKWNVQNCISNGLVPVMYTTSITDNAAEIEAEAHPLKLEK